METKKKNVQKVKKNNHDHDKDLCFSIMPFGGWFDDYYNNIYCPAIEAAGLKPCRADDLYRPSTIVNDIWSFTKKSKIILADLTGKNPNVFYELGLAHALAKPAILVVENMADVPFDLRALRVIEYDKNAPNWGDVLKEKIEISINEVLESPSQSVLPTFLDVRESGKKPTVTEREKEFIEMRQDIDVLRRELLSSRNRYMREDITPDSAKSLIHRFVKMRLPQDTIIKRVTDRGAPEQWVIDNVKNIMQEIDEEQEENKSNKILFKRKSESKKKSVK
jgi:hypothetical protein